MSFGSAPKQGDHAQAPAHPRRRPPGDLPWMGVWAWLPKWLVVLSELRGLGVLGVTRMRRRSSSPKRSGTPWSGPPASADALRSMEPMSNSSLRVSGRGGGRSNASLRWEGPPAV